MILLQFQKDYSSMYGINVWDNASVDQTELVRYIRNCTVSQLARVYALDLAGEGLGIALTDEETGLARSAAKEYLDAMDKEVEKYVGAGESEAEDLFERYRLAQKTYANIVAGVSTEVSDEEALVMDMQQICVSSADLASTLLSRLRSGDDFTALAQSYNEAAYIDIPVSRTTFSSDITDQLFSLDTGEYSGVIETDGMYCLFYCENYFDEALTEQNKANVLNRRRESAVDEVCAAYADPAETVFNSSSWAKVETDLSLDLTGPSFREVYQLYFD